MGKNFSTIKGDRKNRYFEEVLTANTSDEEKLERLCTEVSSAWVRNACIPRGATRGKRKEAAAPCESEANSASEPTAAPAVSETTASTTAPAEETPAPATEPPAAPAKSERFNPYALHTTNIFKKDGADGLRSALEDVRDAAHLKSIITAQRLPVTGFDAMNDTALLRASIVTAVQERISDRKAAAT